VHESSDRRIEAGRAGAIRRMGRGEESMTAPVDGGSHHPREPIRPRRGSRPRSLPTPATPRRVTPVPNGSVSDGPIVWSTRRAALARLDRPVLHGRCRRTSTDQVMGGDAALFVQRLWRRITRCRCPRPSGRSPEPVVVPVTEGCVVHRIPDRPPRTDPFSYSPGDSSTDRPGSTGVPCRPLSTSWTARSASSSGVAGSTRSPIRAPSGCWCATWSPTTPSGRSTRRCRRSPTRSPSSVTCWTGWPASVRCSATSTTRRSRRSGSTSRAGCSSPGGAAAS
jgi:hypothetical protein